MDSKKFWNKTRQANKAINDAAYELRTTAGRLWQENTTGYSYKQLSHLRTSTRSMDGEIYVIKLATLRYGIIREHGAGRGWNNGQRAALGPPTGRSRTAAPWISEAFNKVAPKLANNLARIKGEDMVAELDEGLQKAYGKSNYRIG